MGTHHIKQPKNKTVKSGDFDVIVKWDVAFSAKWSETFNYAQRRFDMECLRLCNSLYTPFITGNNLNASGVRASKLGEGELIWDFPGAANLYYNPQYNFTKKHPFAGSHWGRRMKAANKEHLRQFAAHFINRGSK